MNKYTYKLNSNNFKPINNNNKLSYSELLKNVKVENFLESFVTLEGENLKKTIVMKVDKNNEGLLIISLEYELNSDEIKLFELGKLIVTLDIVLKDRIYQKTNAIEKLINNDYKYVSILLKPINGVKTTIKLEGNKDESISISTYLEQPTTEYNNLPTNAFKKMYFMESQFIGILYHNQKRKSKEQIEYDNKYKITTNVSDVYDIPYSQRIIGKPTKMLISFPGVWSRNNSTHVISYLGSLDKHLSNTIIICFQDFELVYGNYMYAFDNGVLKKPYIVDFIKNKMKEFGIDNQDLAFYGNSKGGTIVLDYVDEFDNAKFFSHIPQLDLRNYEASPLQRYLLRYCGAADYYQAHNKIRSINNKNIYYYFAEKDYFCNLKIPKNEITGINVYELEGYGHSGAAQALMPKFIEDYIGK